MVNSLSFLQLTILSPWYIRAVDNSGGEELLAWASVSLYTCGLLQQATGAGDLTSWAMNDTLASAMGDFDSSPTTSLLSRSYPELSSFAFGPWLYNKAVAPYRNTLQSSTSGSFSPAEMRGLYHVISNSSLLAGSSLTSHDSDLPERCQSWASEVCFGGTGGGRSAGLDLSLATCGVIYLLQTCRENVSSTARDILHQAFCPLGAGSDPCLDFQTASQTLAVAYGHALSDYLAFLSSHFLNVFLEHKQLRLVEQRLQSQLALGFQAQAGSSFVPMTFYSGLLFSEWGTERSETNPLWTVYTCLQNRDMDNNMKLIGKVFLLSDLTILMFGAGRPSQS